MTITMQQPFNDFEALVSSSELPILVVFYAHWCGPSHMLDSILEQVKSRMEQQLKIVKIDSESHSDLATRYHVHPLPTLVLFKNGQPVERIEEEQTQHLMSAEHLIQRLETLISS